MARLFSTSPDGMFWCNSSPDGWTIINVIGAYILTLYADLAIVMFCLVWKEWYYLHAILFLIASFLALWSHTKTMMTNPGAVPENAQPMNNNENGYCTKCDAFKPKSAYHCSKCKRCIVRMDHHCPYTNNCVGAHNQKFMILFLLYCNIQALYAIGLCVYYGSISKAFLERNIYNWLQRIAAFCFFFDGVLTLSFTGEMMRRQILSIYTGVGTIDRLKLAKGKKIAGGTPLPLSAIFGIDFPLLWLFPFDPFFENPEQILGFRQPKNLETPAVSSAETPLLATSLQEDTI
uniref:Palmitoyltransferase n=1 Tax=Aureoumbra lagunensis TaxID=44058 RepID=A0A7S3K509_9STRA|mmetsp:Transcript_7830/g.11876  ORF Transcript_7830/g.11876 Transcript_7830/m.11876 type:complete len:290 (+) Transcript_7830:21-890(+)